MYGKTAKASISLVFFQIQGIPQDILSTAIFKTFLSLETSNLIFPYFLNLQEAWNPCC